MRLVSQFKVGEGSQVVQQRPALARPGQSGSSPVASPARRMMGDVARAFNGSAAVAQNTREWEDF
ncbi:hypothetical protein D3C80_1920340 [compost metagenome]